MYTASKNIFRFFIEYKILNKLKKISSRNDC